MLTVRELIDKLLDLPMDATVTIDTPERFVYVTDAERTDYSNAKQIQLLLSMPVIEQPHPAQEK